MKDLYIYSAAVKWAEKVPHNMYQYMFDGEFI